MKRITLALLLLISACTKNKDGATQPSEDASPTTMTIAKDAACSSNVDQGSTNFTVDELSLGSVREECGDDYGNENYKDPRDVSYAYQTNRFLRNQYPGPELPVHVYAESPFYNNYDFDERYKNECFSVMPDRYRIHKYKESVILCDENTAEILVKDIKNVPFDTLYRSLEKKYGCEKKRGRVEGPSKSIELCSDVTLYENYFVFQGSPEVDIVLLNLESVSINRGTCAAEESLKGSVFRNINLYVYYIRKSIMETSKAALEIHKQCKNKLISEEKADKENKTKSEIENI
jgi:hypothetical protein